MSSSMVMIRFQWDRWYQRHCGPSSLLLRVSQAAETVTEDKKKAKVEKVKKCIRTAAGTSWEDSSLLEWETGVCVCLCLCVMEC